MAHPSTQRCACCVVFYVLLQGECAPRRSSLIARIYTAPMEPRKVSMDASISDAPEFMRAGLSPQKRAYRSRLTICCKGISQTPQLSRLALKIRSFTPPNETRGTVPNSPRLDAPSVLRTLLSPKRRLCSSYFRVATRGA